MHLEHTLSIACGPSLALLELATVAAPGLLEAAAGPALKPKRLLQLLSTRARCSTRCVLLLLGGGGGGGHFTLATRLASLCGHVDPWSCCNRCATVPLVDFMLFRQRVVP